MGYYSYYDRRRPTAPASVHVVAFFQYVGALATLAAAALAAMIARGAVGGVPLDRIPQGVRDGVTGTGLVIAITLGVLGLFWLVVARKLQRGRQWARFTVVVLSLLTVTGTALDFWHGRRPDVLAGLALPLLFLALLSTRPARIWFRYATRG
jgi:hypothetical protein